MHFKNSQFQNFKITALTLSKISFINLNSLAEKFFLIYTSKPTRMRQRILPTAFFAAILLFSANQMFAQNNTGFAITGATKGNIAWMVIREIDLSTGAEVRTIYAPENKPALVDAVTGKRLTQLGINARVKSAVTTVNRNGVANTMVTYANGDQSEVVTAPTETFVAASAFDTKNNRLFFTPMHSNELRYFDLNRGTNNVYYVRNVALKNFAETKGEADVITRMCFGADGYGYALTNDFNHLIRFSSGDKITITDLGSVTDGKNNKDISIRNMCTSWGGDMIADAFGNLYVISMRGNIFKINPRNMVADHIAAIKNLPADYTINGAAVDAQNNLIISCATKTDHYYNVNISTWEATPLANQKDQQVYNASDLASSHIAFENAVKSQEVSSVQGNSVITVFPNPVINRTINVSFDAFAGKDHTVQLVNVNGHVILNKVLNINGKTTSQVILPGNVNSGTYIIKVNDSNGKEQYSGKIIVY
jgi:hypothetical protein